MEIIFGIGMLVLAVTMSLPDRQRLIKKSQYHKTCKEVHGDQVCFLLPKNKVPMMSLAGLNDIFMGLVSVGIGEINEFLFVKRFKIHSGIAAGTSILPILLLITLPLIAGHQPAFAEDPELSTVVFYVG
jgi:hypothetical protein